MKNPFDENFFRFLLGFSVILSFSFAVLFFTGQYSLKLDEKEATVLEGK